MSHLQGRFRCVTTSLLGYGGTAERRASGDAEICLEREIIESVVRRAGGPVHLVGHSFGGLVALATALRGRVPLLSLTIVFSVLVYVFPLRMLVSSGFHWISGGRLPGSTLINTVRDLSDLFFLYGLGFAFLGLLFVGLFAHVAR